MGYKTILVILFVTLSFLADKILCQPCGNAEDWIQYKGRCYRASNDGPDDLVNYTTAVQICESMEAQLASTTDQDELDFVMGITECKNHPNCTNVHHGVNQYWIILEQNPPVSEMASYEDRRMGWKWGDGSLYLWTNWYNGEKIQEHEPTGDVGRVRLLYTGKWADVEASHNCRYICKTQVGSTSNPSLETTQSRHSTTITSRLAATTSATAISRLTNTTTSPQSMAAALDTNAFIGIGAGVAGFIILLVVIIMVAVIYRRKHAGKSLAQGDYYNTRSGAAPPDENTYNEIDGPGYAEVGGKPGTAPAHSHTPRPVSTHSATPLPGHTIAPTGVEYATVDKSRKTSNKSRHKSSADEETTVVDNNIYAPSLDCIMR